MEELDEMVCSDSVRRTITINHFTVLVFSLDHVFRDGAAKEDARESRRARGASATVDIIFLFLFEIVPLLGLILITWF